MVDTQATIETKKVYAYLKKIQGKGMLFGHQNTTSSGVTFKEESGESSDIKTLVGDYPAVYGWDTLALIGIEGEYEKLKVWVEKAAARGGIITLSAHMLNPMTGGTFNEVQGGEVCEILRYKGSTFERFKAHLDLIAQFAHEIKLPSGAPVPIIFRPFHEHSGSWFWWGKNHCTEAEYLELFRYTVDYLKETKGIHNFIYAYSPNGHFEDEADYLDRYPGDDYVDLLGFDIYQDCPQENDGWLEKFIGDCQIISDIAAAKEKVGAVTEVGIRWNAEDGIAPKDNAIPNWYTGLLKAMKDDHKAKRMVYMLNWWNGSTKRFWAPYKGHEMAEDFKAFYHDSYMQFNGVIENIYKA